LGDEQEPDVVDKVLTLFDEGNSRFQISRMMGIPFAVVYEATKDLKGSGHLHLRMMRHSAFKVVRPDLPKPCRVWTGTKTGEYGSITIHGKNKYTHIAAYEDKHGPIPKGMEVCHRCDNPPCWEDTHLFLDTHQGNIDDRAHKGRSAKLRGHLHPNAKFTPTQIREIRLRHKAGWTEARIAQTYNASIAAISNILQGLTYQNVEDDV
jgi:hypothetical protein